jgi:selenocysteine-specific elongation factor
VAPAPGNDDELLARVEASLRARQSSEPWAMGTTSLALSRELGINESDLIGSLRQFVDGGALISRAGYVATADFEPHLTSEQQAFFDATIVVDPGAPNLPMSRKLLFAAISASTVPGLSRAFDTLATLGSIAVVGDDIYRDRQIAAIRADVRAYLQTNGRMTMAQFRDLLGTSRRYAVPLLEWFDACGITVREGDERVAPNCP